MLAHLTAFDLLALVLVVGSIAALCGYAGGAGARLSFAVRVDRVEGAVMQLLNRAKGANGGAVAQVQKQRVTSAEKEAEALAAKLVAAGGGARQRGPRGTWLTGPRSPVDAAEEESFREIERAQDAARNGKPS